MDIQSILNTFKAYDKNNDDILSQDELKACKGTIWEELCNSNENVQKGTFIIYGLRKETDTEPRTGFEIMHKKLSQMGIQPINFCSEDCPIKDYVIYKNGARLYTKEVNNYNELPDASTPGVKSAKGVDISKLNLSEQELLSLIIDKYTTMSDKQREIFEKANNNCSQMGLGIDKVIENGFRGTGTMALLDQEYCGHKIYADKVVYTTNLNKPEFEDKSWHCASMLSIMNKTSPDTNIMHYCVTNENRETMDAQFAEAIRDIINKNKTLPEDKKVKTIIMGWGFYKDSPKYDEYIQLCNEAVSEGIFICSNNTSELYGIELSCTDRNPLEDVNNPSNYKLASFIDKNIYKADKGIKDNTLFFPTQHLTIAHEDGTSYQYEGADGGACWSNSIGALYNTFLSIKSDLTPQEFMNLLKDTSDEFLIDGNYYGRILNAENAMKALVPNN